jgi:cytochrome c biogenesis DsbD-like protein
VNPMTFDGSLTAALGIGFVLGLRHATDADHVVAVSTFVSREPNLVRSWLVGTFWGAGHTLSLLAAGLATIVFKLTLPPGTEKTLETIVALVLILLGGHAVLGSLGPVHLHRHEHGGREHAHVHVRGLDRHTHRDLLVRGSRPFLVGMLHGLAGSAALMLLVLASIPSPLAGVLYIAVFGLGSTAGMLVLSSAIALPFMLSAAHSDRASMVVRVLAGLASTALGIWLVWTLGD